MKKYFTFLLYTPLLVNLTFSTALAQKKNPEAETKKSQAEYYFTEGMKYFILESYAKSTDFFQRSLELNPESGGTHYAMASALSKLNKFDEALRFAEKALKLDENNKYYYILTAQIYGQQKKYAQAIKIYQDLIKKIPGMEEYYFELAALYTYQNKYDDAVKTYEKIEKYFGFSEDVTIQKQLIFLRQNKPDQAIEETRKLAAHFPEEDKYQYMVAELLINFKKNAEAITVLENLLKKNPDHAEARVLLTSLLREKGDNSKADQELEKTFNNPELSAQTKVKMLADFLQKVKNDEKNIRNALHLAEIITIIHPKEAVGYAAYGDVLRAMNESAKSRDMYLKATDLGISSFEVWRALLELDSDINDFAGLVKHSEQALTLYPSSAVFFYFNGMGNLIRKNYRQAVDALEQGKTFSLGNEEMISQFDSMLGDAYNGVNDYQKSDEAYDAALKKNPHNAGVLNNYSYYLSLRKEKLDQAKQMSARLIDDFPDNSTYLDTHAWVLYMLKDYQGAKKYLEKALAQTAENGTIIEHYGDVLFKLGQKDKAVEQWIKAKKAGETSGMIDKKIADKMLYEK
jgi:tetratricopeptide (TPR) repeat protein